MIKIPLTNAEKDISIRAAQDGFASSVKRFENALELLAEKVEDSAQQFKIVKEIVNTPKDIAVAVKARAEWVAQAVKRNPAGYLIAAVTIIGAYWWLRSQKIHWAFPDDLEV